MAWENVYRPALTRWVNEKGNIYLKTAKYFHGRVTRHQHHSYFSD